MSKHSQSGGSNIKKSNGNNRIQILFCGEQGVGKSSIIQWYKERRDIKNFPNVTIGPKLEDIEYDILGENFKLRLCDVPGQQTVYQITDNVIKNSQGFVFIYNIMDEGSLKNVQEWMTKINTQKDIQKVTKILVGNKVDTYTNSCFSIQQNAKELAQNYNMHYFETSVTQSLQLDEALTQLVTLINKEQKEQPQQDSSRISEKDLLENSKLILRKKNCFGKFLSLFSSNK